VRDGARDAREALDPLLVDPDRQAALLQRPRELGGAQQAVQALLEARLGRAEGAPGASRRARADTRYMPAVTSAGVGIPSAVMRPRPSTRRACW